MGVLVARQPGHSPVRSGPLRIQEAEHPLPQQIYPQSRQLSPSRNMTGSGSAATTLLAGPMTDKSGGNCRRHSHVRPNNHPRSTHGSDATSTRVARLLKHIMIYGHTGSLQQSRKAGEAIINLYINGNYQTLILSRRNRGDRRALENKNPSL